MEMCIRDSRENSDKTYTLRAVKTTQTNSNDKEFSMTNDLAGITVETNKICLLYTSVTRSSP